MLTTVNGFKFSLILQKCTLNITFFIPLQCYIYFISPVSKTIKLLSNRHGLQQPFSQGSLLSVSTMTGRKANLETTLGLQSIAMQHSRLDISCFEEITSMNLYHIELIVNMYWYFPNNIFKPLCVTLWF